MKDLEFIWAGRVSVDSGLLAIGDPGYWTDKRLDYTLICKALDEATEEDLPPIELGNLGDCSMSLVFPTLTGDGIYDVYTVWRGEEPAGFFTSFVDDDFMEQEVE